jgi:hypothetical protein
MIIFFMVNNDFYNSLLNYQLLNNISKNRYAIYIINSLW